MLKLKERHKCRQAICAIPMVSLVSMVAASTVNAANPEHIQQLQHINYCVGCDLSNADLRQFNLRNANLSGANLRDANLSDLNLTGANFSDANLRGADLSRAISNEACDIVYEWFEQTRLADSQRQEHTFADATGLCLLSELVDIGLVLGVDFETAPQTAAFFSVFNAFGLRDRVRTSFRGADLSGAMLKNARFRGVNLNSATLDHSDLSDADLSYAFLVDASLRNVHNANLNKAFVDQSAVLTFLIELSSLAEQGFVALANRAREAEARTYLGAMMRGQQAYILEYGEFSANLEQIGPGLRSETENYAYRLTFGGDGLSVFIYAEPKIATIRGFVGAVYAISEESPMTISGLCQGDVLGRSPLSPPALNTSPSIPEITCMPGTSKGMRAR